MLITQIEKMKTLLGSIIPSRNQIKNIELPSNTKKYKLMVFRTMPFEYISNLIPYFIFGNESIEYEISGYDPSLSDISENDADGYILWLDWRIYQKTMTAEAAVQWLLGRIHFLRNQTKKSIFVNNWPENMEYGEVLFSPLSGSRSWTQSLNYHLSNMIDQVSGCSIIDLEWFSNSSNFVFFDKRNDQITQYPFSDKATIVIARHLGVHLFPTLVMPRIKAIALDLDETLYKGILGEDGARGIKLTEGHEKLQQILLRLKASGVMLTLCSRNVEEDVKLLFNSRKDFPLNWDDFSAIAVNWHSKSQNIFSLAQKLNISTCDFLFIDDNIVELSEVKYSIPEIKILHADQDGNETSSFLCNYPGLYQLNTDDTGHLRTDDIKANQIRKTMKNNSINQNEYLSKLQMKIRLFENMKTHTRRVFELSQKTNQFNLNIRRFNEPEIEVFMEESSKLVITVELSDVLSNSGIIGALICTINGKDAYLIETLFSCRALGRNIEVVVFYHLLIKLKNNHVQTISIDYTEGPRNAPAKEWLAEFIGDKLINIDLVELIEKVKKFCIYHPSKIEEYT